MAFMRQLALAVGVAIAGLGHSAAAQTGDESALFSETARLNNDSLLWGPYRPNLYFGVRPRIPKSLVSGLMWGRADTYTDLQNHVRYTCEQNEGMEGYGWDEYDTRRGGAQTIHDTFNNIDITTSFVKVPGGAHGGSWGARIKGVPRPKAPTDDHPDASVKTMVVFYLAQEEDGSAIRVADVSGRDWDELGFAGDVTFEGASSGLGDYKVVVTKGTGAHPQSDHAYAAERDLEKTVVQSLTAPEEHLWQTKPLLFQRIKEAVDHVIAAYDPNAAPPPWHVYQLGNQPGPGNLQFVQRMYEGAFEFDILFSSASAGKDLTSDDVTREIRAASESFGAKFNKVFSLQAPFAADTYRAFAHSMFSNLIGGIGYFYGYGIADRSYAAAYEEEDEGFWEDAAQARAAHRETMDGPYELFTSIPSRPFFPRGFLWDEGFHLLPIADWDMDLTLDIVKSWFNLMDDDGWIAREQILGSEARSKVPAEFQIQYPHYANPPTLFFVVDRFVQKLRQAANGTAGHDAAAGSSSNLVDNTELGLEYLRALYPRLRRQYDWFRRTQFGDIKSYERSAFSKREAYRWRGRTEAHVLTSGLDDYPRPQPPHPGELHVDLMAWMGMMTRSLLNIAEVLGTDASTEEAQQLRAIQEAIARNLDDLHWSEDEGCYCDATVDDYEENKLVCHRGYISLFPLLVGLLEPTNPKVGRLLDLLGDEDELFSPHGLRSLSKKSPLYGTAENYWRSPVWININYLALVQLQALGQQAGPFRARAADLYNRLRRNIVDTVYASWKETGFAWEQYNPETGKGQRTQHFTGWTSLVVKIMAMPEVDVTTGHVRDEL
ncbi:mannosyl-oligosaccharide glucosidase [Sporothrix schenckii 1099-18]|uniref:Mannosyl-oligosaccharide glucosidase n=1 Tax=Sporothrix schenckii 1099-18 TaxID=1397361 RepID=A0A0F2MJT2_SPOSC|nr:mannosyl-oligosaccharide glucosidase [Sporothrix schenckii 1099-18]KJR89943.1 mannosyl-oligosaccharide glucosidase [Sporothrix schenckii 1099-18]